MKTVVLICAGNERHIPITANNGRHVRIFTNRHEATKYLRSEYPSVPMEKIMAFYTIADAETPKIEAI